MNRNIGRRFEFAIVALLAMLIFDLFTGAQLGRSQNPSVYGTQPVQLQQAYYPLTPISATNAVNTATTLTIPAPTQSGFYNYVCYLAYQLNIDATGGTVTTNQVTTSTNFNAFAVKVSNPGTANTDTGAYVLLNGTPGAGCVKSTSPTTSTTFVSPASQTHLAWTWYATFFQAP